MGNAVAAGRERSAFAQRDAVPAPDARAPRLPFPAVVRGSEGLVSADRRGYGGEDHAQLLGTPPQSSSPGSCTVMTASTEKPPSLCRL